MGVRSDKSLNLDREQNNNLVVFCDDRDVGKEKEANEKETNESSAVAPSSSGKTKKASVSFEAPKTEREPGLQTLLPRRPKASPFSSVSPETRAPACSCSSAFLPAGRPDTEKAKRRPQVVLGCRRSTLLPTRHTMVLTALLSWAAFFGVGTLQRCKDWNSERALFESALKVCPDSIKTLNNLAAGMLNKKEAGRAEVLLLRAVEVSLDDGQVAVCANDYWVSLILLCPGRSETKCVTIFSVHLECE